MIPYKNKLDQYLNDDHIDTPQINDILQNGIPGSLYVNIYSLDQNVPRNEYEN